MTATKARACRTAKSSAISFSPPRKPWLLISILQMSKLSSGEFKQATPACRMGVLYDLPSWAEVKQTHPKVRP